MAPSPASPDSVFTGVLANLGLKATALGISVLLYAIVHGTQDAQQTFSVPLVASLPRTEMVLSDPLPPTIQVSLRGPRAKLRDLRAEGIAPLTLVLPPADATRIEVDGSQLDLPAGVRVEQLEPSELTLKWEKPVERVVPVRVALGSPPPGLVVEGTPVALPPTVLVRGLARRLEVLQAVPTDALDLTQAQRGSGERRVGLVVPDGLLAVDPERVAVRFSLREATTVHAFAHVPVAVLGGAAKTQPAVVAVRFVCPIDAHVPPRAEDLVAFVRIPEAHVDLVDVQVERGACTAEVTPARVIVRR